MKREYPLNALGLSHQFMAAHICAGDTVIDGTAGRGRDALFLCRLVGESGRVLALDIQADAVAQTTALLTDEGVAHRAEVVQTCHSRLAALAAPGSVDGIMFNFGWLPGGDHNTFYAPTLTFIQDSFTARSVFRPTCLLLCLPLRVWQVGVLTEWKSWLPAVA